MKMGGGGGERDSGKIFNKWCDFVHSTLFFSTNFVSFFFLDIFLVFYPLILLVWHDVPTELLVRQTLHLPYSCLRPS